MEIQAFWPQFIEDKISKGETNFDIVKIFFDNFKEYLGDEKKQEELLSKCDFFRKLKEIIFGNAEISFDEFDTIDKKIEILEYLNKNRDLYSKGKMKKELLEAIIPILIEVQKYIIKTRYYEKEELLFLMAETFKCVKEEKEVFLLDLLKEEKNFIDEEFAIDFMDL